jgi:hypothetical protein
MSKTPRPLNRRLRASLDQDHLRKILGLLYTPDGKPSPALKKSIDHFKDRFKEVVKNVEAGEGSKAGRPSSSMTTTPEGCILTVQCQMESGSSDTDDARRYLEAVEARLLTPTMSKTGFNLVRDRAPELSMLSSRSNGCVGAELELKGGKMVLTAAMVFHHPGDKYVLAKEDTAFPSGEVALSDGSTAVFRDDVQFLTLTKNLYLAGTGYPRVLAIGQKTTEAASQAHLVFEAANSSRATFDSLIALMGRMGIRALPSNLRDPQDPVIKKRLNKVQDQLGRMAITFVMGLMGHPRIVADRPKPDRFEADLDALLFGARVRLEVVVEADPDSSAPLQLRLEGNLTDPSIGRFARPFSISQAFWRSKEDVDLLSAGAAKKILDHCAPSLEKAVALFLEEGEGALSRAEMYTNLVPGNG